MKKQIAALVTCTAMVGSLLIGCGSSSNETTSTTTASSEASTTTASADSGDVRTFQLGHIDSSTEKDAYQIFAVKFAENVDEMSGGKIKINVKGDAQLGSESEMYEAMQLGDLDFGIITNNLYANTVKDFEIFDLPFLLSDYDVANSVVDDPEVFGHLQETLDNEGIHLLTYSDSGFRYVVNNKRPIETVADLKGLKIRLPEAAMFISSFKALGANPTSMAFSEAYTAVQQGTVDGLEITAMSIVSNGYDQICKYVSKTKHFWSPITLDMSGTVWSSLSEDDQKILVEAAEKARDDARVEVYANEEGFFDEMEAAGCEVNDIKDPQEFRDAAQSVYDEAQSEIDPDFWNLVMSKIEK